LSTESFSKRLSTPRTKSTFVSRNALDPVNQKKSVLPDQGEEEGVALEEENVPKFLKHLTSQALKFLGPFGLAHGKTLIFLETLTSKAPILLGTLIGKALIFPRTLTGKVPIDLRTFSSIP
jgi:hypothetical protein